MLAAADKAAALCCSTVALQHHLARASVAGCGGRRLAASAPPHTSTATQAGVTPRACTGSAARTGCWAPAGPPQRQKLPSWAARRMRCCLPCRPGRASPLRCCPTCCAVLSQACACTCSCMGHRLAEPVHCSGLQQLSGRSPAGQQSTLAAHQPCSRCLCQRGCAQDGGCDTVLRGQGNVWLTKQDSPDARTLVVLEQLPDDNLAAATASAQHLLKKLAAPST